MYFRFNRTILKFNPALHSKFILHMYAGICFVLQPLECAFDIIVFHANHYGKYTKPNFKVFVPFDESLLLHF